MKRIIYFILACLTIAYIGLLCYSNIALDVPSWIYYLEVYGGLAIAVAYAFINFFGSPLKMVFFKLLILAVVVLILSICIPDAIRSFFGLIK